MNDRSQIPGALPQRGTGDRRRRGGGDQEISVSIPPQIGAWSHDAPLNLRGANGHHENRGGGIRTGFNKVHCKSLLSVADKLVTDKVPGT